MRWGAAVIMSLGLVASGCAKPPEGPPVVVEASQVEPLLYWASDLRGKRVAIDGYLWLDNGRNGEAIAIGQILNTQPSGRGREIFHLQAPEGEGPGQLNLPVLERGPVLGRPGLPETLTIDMSHATWQDVSGATHPLKEKVRVTGRLDYRRVTNVGLMSEADLRSPTGSRFQPVLTDITLDTPAG